MAWEYGGLRSGADQKKPIVGKNPDGTVKVELHQDGRITGPNETALLAALTAKDASTVDATYGQAEADVIANNRTRVEELEARLRTLGILP